MRKCCSCFIHQLIQKLKYTKITKSKFRALFSVRAHTSKNYLFVVRIYYFTYMRKTKIQTTTTNRVLFNFFKQKFAAGESVTPKYLEN